MDIQGSDDKHLEWSGGSDGGEKWLESGHILEPGSEEFAGGLNVKYDKKREDKCDPESLDLSNQENENTIY